jgi:hypothetical protein
MNQKEINQRIEARNKALAKDKRDHGWNHTAYRKGPKAELLARLNAYIKGIDPGAPVNWRGL